MTQSWTTPDDVSARVRRVWDKGELLAARLGGPTPFPMRFRVRRPDSREMGAQFAAVRAWIATLEQASRTVRGFGYDLEWEEINFREVGKNRVPSTVVIPSEADALRLIGRSGDAARWDDLVSSTATAFPQLRGWLRENPLTLLEHQADWEHVLAVLLWFGRNPRRGIYLRQVDVPGVDTKFIESRRSLLSELLDLVLAPECIDATAIGARAFEQRYGLLTKPLRLRIRSLDEGLSFGGLVDVEAPVSEWARKPLEIDRLVLVENEINFLSFPALPRTAIAFGAGYSVVDRLPELAWLRDRPIFYWGDIDTHGFVILDRLRRTFPHARSFLMDRETFLDHRRMWVSEEIPEGVALDRLTVDETELYDDLRRDTYGPSVRLEQERISFAHVQQALEWIGMASLVPFRRATSTGFVFETEDPSFTHEPESWIDPREVRNWVQGDPLLDWLNAFGNTAGLQRDDELPTYDARTDFRLFVQEKSAQFKEAVFNLLAARAPTAVRIPRTHLAEEARATLDALRSGAGVILRGLLLDPARGANCRPDVLIRSDLLASWFPDALTQTEAEAGSPALGHDRIHYRPVVLGFRTFDLTADGHLSTAMDQLVHAVEGWFCAQAISDAQGLRVPRAYALGRNWRQDEQRGRGTLERLARIDTGRWLPQRDCTLADLARSAAAWLRRLRRDGKHWRVLPEPSVPELYPHARNLDDSPWHATKRRLAEELEELTLLPGMNPQRRMAAHEVGLTRWRQKEVTAAALLVMSPVAAAQLDAVLAANRSPSPTVLPNRIETGSERWRRVLAIEFFVDFETVSHLEDDLADLPNQGGRSLIAQVGCGHVTSDGVWRFAQWTVDSLTIEEERRVLDAWLVHMSDVCRAAGVELSASQVCHWSAAERVHLETAYDNARQRHPSNAWPAALPWFDVLQDVVRAAPVAVTGAFSFGLKAIAKAMHSAGFIATTWPSGPTDGLGAMVATWRAARETGELSKHPLMLEVGRYNETDCRVMMEILSWLRANR